jgi:hypothetical protein
VLLFDTPAYAASKYVCELSYLRKKCEAITVVTVVLATTAVLFNVVLKLYPVKDGSTKRTRHNAKNGVWSGTLNIPAALLKYAPEDTLVKVTTVLPVAAKDLIGTLKSHSATKTLQAALLFETVWT